MIAETPLAFSLRTRRLYLREFVTDDARELSAMHSDARISTHLFDEPQLAQMSVCEAFLERLELFYRQHQGLGIWHASLPGEKAASAFAGWFSLLPMPGEASAIELGGRLTAATWGRNIGIEGGVALLAHAFKTLHLDAVWGTCHPQNRAASIILDALDFQFAGVRDYNGHRASHFYLPVNRWSDSAHQSAGKRLRRAIAAQRLAPAQSISQS